MGIGLRSIQGERLVRLKRNYIRKRGIGLLLHPPHPHQAVHPLKRIVKGRREEDILLLQIRIRDVNSTEGENTEIEMMRVGGGTMKDAKGEEADRDDESIVN